MSIASKMREASANIAANSLSDLTYEEKKLVEYALLGGDSVNLPYAVRNVSKTKLYENHTKHAIEVAMHRAAGRLNTRGVGTVEKREDGLIWLSIDRSIVRELICADTRREAAPRADTFDLIKVSCEIPTSTEKGMLATPKHDIYATPKNASGERLAAIHLLKGVKMLTAADKADIERRFNYYNDEVSQKIIALMDAKSGEVIGSEYSTRFNDVRKAAISLRKFDNAVDISLKENYYAVFLTLTTDPKLFASNWEANRHFAVAWNKFMSFLTKRKGGRPQYISSYEFQKNGLLHNHTLIFAPYLIDKDDITKEWERVGQGTINHVCRLKNVIAKGGKSREWRWSSFSRPRDAKGMSGGDYLKKYLKKATLAMTDGYEDPSSIQAMYWAMNKRFWSSSRSLLVKNDSAVSEEASDAQWMFYGIFDATEASPVDRIVYRRGGSTADEGIAEADQ